MIGLIVLIISQLVMFLHVDGMTQIVRAWPDLFAGMTIYDAVHARFAEPV